MANERLVVFGDDWGRHPSSIQHLTRNLLPGYRVDWINTIGARMPKLRRADFRRVFEKLTAFAEGAREVPSRTGNLRVHSTVTWPRMRTESQRRLNGALLLHQLLAPVLLTRPMPSAVITTTPIVADLARRTPGLNWVYYCVDDLSEWPGFDGPALRAMELELLKHVRSVVAVSENLRERLGRLGVPSTLLTHGVDVEHWSAVRGRSAALRGDAPVRALYWGLADRRLDADICLAVAARAELVFVGPKQNVDPRLLRHPNIRWLPAVRPPELPRIAAHADVLVMPYADLPVTRACQPLKLKEYLATQMPVVVTPLPANRDWSDACDLAGDPQTFAAHVLARATKPIPASQRAARERLECESWRSKARELIATLFPREARVHA